MSGDWQEKMQKEIMDNAPVLTQEFGFSLFAGYATGMAMRFAGKVAAVGIGGAFVFLQSLAYSGYIQVDWGKVEREYRQLLDLDGDGQVTTNDAHIIFEKLKHVLVFNLPSGAGFTGGMMYGMGGSIAAASKLGIGMGVTGIAARGLAVTGAPPLLAVMAEYDDGRIKGALDKGKMMMHEYGVVNYWEQAKGAVGGLQTMTSSPEVKLQVFKDTLEGQSLDTLRNLEVDLKTKMADSGIDTILMEQLAALNYKKAEVKLQSKKGWFW